MVNLEAQPRSMEGNILSPSELRKVRREAYCRFASIGLSGREISFALEIETGRKVAAKDIVNLVHQARRRGTIRQLTPEEKIDIARTTANPWEYTDEVIKKDVRAILRGVEMLQAKGEPLPQNRLELAKFRLPHVDLQPTGEGIHVGSKIIFPDGRHLPTLEGRSQSESVKKRNRRPKPREEVIKQSTVWSKVKPLRERLALYSEIAEITGFTIRQVKKALYDNKLRPEWNRMPAFTPEQVAELKKKADRARKAKKSGEQRITDTR